MSRTFLLAAFKLRGTACPVCGETWLCAEDIRRRQPLFFDDGEAVCMLCAKQLEGLDEDEVARTHLSRCLEFIDDDDCFFSDEEERTLRRIDGKLRVGAELEDSECGALYNIYLSIEGLEP